ncbi:MAG: mismatch-specific DNA-glycosylase [Marinibacterium sp.]
MVLPDIISYNLNVLFCGTAVGARSADIGNYYAHPGNKFWKVLAETGLTPRKFKPSEQNDLLLHGLGLTDLAKEVSGRDAEIAQDQFAPERLANLVAEYHPRRVAFNGKAAARVALSLKRNPSYGLFASAPFDGTDVWILPSTSGAASGYWSYRVWADLAEAVQLRGTS